MKNRVILCLGVSAALMLTGCGGAAGVREQLGLRKSAPDEFAVIKRAPLEVLPPYALDKESLPVPQPGAPRPQELAPDIAAQQALFGGTTAQGGGLSGSDSRLLDLAGANESDPQIRAQVDAETGELEKGKIPVATKLLNLAKGNKQVPATVVDAEKEAARIRANKAAGKPITEGETPSITQ